MVHLYPCHLLLSKCFNFGGRKLYFDWIWNKVHSFWKQSLDNLWLTQKNCSFLQVNLFQKLATSAEHFVYQNCSEWQNKTKTTICAHNIFCRHSELTIFINNEQFVVIMWVNWCKNMSFWQRFTCTWNQVVV